MSYGIEHFDDIPSEHELASEKRQPPPRPKARDARLATALAYTDAKVRRSERETMKALTSAVAEVLRQERAEHRAVIAELRSQVEMLQQRLDALEREAPASRSRTAMSAVRGKAENICSH